MSTNESSNAREAAESSSDAKSPVPTTPLTQEQDNNPTEPLTRETPAREPLAEEPAPSPQPQPTPRLQPTPPLQPTPRLQPTPPLQPIPLTPPLEPSYRVERNIDDDEPQQARIGTVVWGLIVIALAALLVISTLGWVVLDGTYVLIGLMIGAGAALVIGGLLAARKSAGKPKSPAK